MTDALKFKIDEEVLVNCGHHVHKWNDEKGVVTSYAVYPDGADYRVKRKSDGLERWHAEFCLSKLQEKPMQNEQDIKIGDTAKIKHPGYRTGDTGVLIDVPISMGTPCCVEFPDGEKVGYFENRLEKIPQEIVEAEVKLEVGQPYIIKYTDKSEEIYSYCGETKKYLLFEDNEGFTLELPKSSKDCYSIKKHSEPFKHKITYYFAYGEEDYCKDFPGDLFRADVRCIWRTLDEVKSDGNFDPEHCLIGKIELDATVYYDVEE